MLTMAVVIPLTGFLMGRFSTRQVFSIAMTLFTIGTVVCVLAPGFLPLLAGRIVQACGTAIMMPLLMTTVMNLVPPSKHGRVMRSEEHTSELQSRGHLVCRLLHEKKNRNQQHIHDDG